MPRPCIYGIGITRVNVFMAELLHLGFVVQKKECNSPRILLEYDSMRMVYLCTHNDTWRPCKKEYDCKVITLFCLLLLLLLSQNYSSTPSHQCHPCYLYKHSWDHRFRFKSLNKRWYIYLNINCWKKKQNIQDWIRILYIWFTNIDGAQQRKPTQAEAYMNELPMPWFFLRY